MRCIPDNSVPAVVLVSSQHGGVGIVRSLGREGIPVYGVHQSAWEPAARSRFLRGISRWDFPSSSAEDSVAFLLDIAKRIGTSPVLIPTSDETASLVADNASALAKGYLFRTPAANLVHTFSSKKRLSDLCRRLGIPCAETVLPHSREDVLRFLEATRFPVIVKGEHGEFLASGGQSVRVAIVPDEKQLLEIFDRNATRTRTPGIILQEYIPGGDDSVWMFNGYFDRQSHCLFGATGRKLRQFPVHRGSTSLGICLRNEVVESQTLRLMQAVGYCGPVDMGYRFDARDGQYKLLDLNPRIGATFRLFVAENRIDTACALYLDCTGQTVPPATVRDGRKWIVESNDSISSWHYFREGHLGPAAWLRSFRGVEEATWLLWDDPLPALMLPSLWLHKRFGNRVRAKSGTPAKELVA